MWGPDVPVIEPHVALRRLALAMLGFISLGAFVKTAMTPEHPAVRREYPFSGLSRELGGPEENQVREELSTSSDLHTHVFSGKGRIARGGGLKSRLD